MLKFKDKKCYEHKSGRMIRILCETNTIKFGPTFFAEELDTTGILIDRFLTIPCNFDRGDDWSEISQKEFEEKYRKDLHDVKLDDQAGVPSLESILKKYQEILADVMIDIDDTEKVSKLCGAALQDISNQLNEDKEVFIPKMEMDTPN